MKIQDYVTTKNNCSIINVCIPTYLKGLNVQIEKIKLFLLSIYFICKSMLYSGNKHIFKVKCNMEDDILVFWYHHASNIPPLSIFQWYFLISCLTFAEQSDWLSVLYSSYKAANTGGLGPYRNQNNFTALTSWESSKLFSVLSEVFCCASAYWLFLLTST